MIDSNALADLRMRLEAQPRANLALLPTPIHPLRNFARLLNGPQLWMKRDDLSGFEGGGNKTRKLEFLVGDALRRGADMLVTIGAIQSNHTRQTAAAAARAGLKCSIVHCAWAEDAGPGYRSVGNLLFSHLMDADLYFDETRRPIEDEEPLEAFAAHLREQGHAPYVIPGGASDHSLGSMGYVNGALEIAEQMRDYGVQFDYIVHCTGSSSTQAGLLAGFEAMGSDVRIIGVSDDDEVAIKKTRVRRLAVETLKTLGIESRRDMPDPEIVAASASAYGQPDEKIIGSIRQLARTEGIVADPVYEGRAIRGLLDLAKAGRFEKDAKILLMHLGGSPATHAYAEYFGRIEMMPFPP